MKLNIKKGLIPIFACLGLLMFSGCDLKKSTANNHKVVAIKMETQPEKTFYLVGEKFDITGATISIERNKSDKKEILPISEDMVSDIDMSVAGEKHPLVTYREAGNKYSYTTSFTITVSDYDTIETEEQLRLAITNATPSKAIYVKAKQTPYHMEHLEITKPVYIIGEKDALISVDKDNISGQAGIYIKASNVTLSNLSIAMDGTSLNALKVSTNTDDTIQVDKILLENLTIEGGKGVNIHGATNTTLRHCTINVDDNTPAVALSVASSTLVVEDCTIYNGKWGSIGFMHKYVDKESPEYENTIKMYPGNGRVFFKGDNTISGHAYIEYSKESKNTFENLDWETIQQGTTTIYWNPKIAKENLTN